MTPVNLPPFLKHALINIVKNAQHGAITAKPYITCTFISLIKSRQNNGELNLKFGVFLYQPEPVEGVDYNFYRLKSESGIVGKPNPEMYTNIACFGDNYMAAKRPDWVSVSSWGPALRTNKRYNLRWDVVCMTNPEAREYNLKIIADCAKVSPGISISSQHFADQHFCTCPRCIEQQRKSGLKWLDWRAKTVTDFLAEVKEIVPGKPLFVNCLPDPLMGRERFGYDFEAMAQYADYFVIPMFSKAYPTPWYWETIARGYKSFLKETDDGKLLRPRSKRNMGYRCTSKTNHDCCHPCCKARRRRHNLPS